MEWIETGGGLNVTWSAVLDRLQAHPAHSPPDDADWTEMNGVPEAEAWVADPTAGVLYQVKLRGPLADGNYAYQAIPLSECTEISTLPPQSIVNLVPVGGSSQEMKLRKKYRIFPR